VRRLSLLSLLVASAGGCGHRYADPLFPVRVVEAAIEINQVLRKPEELRRNLAAAEQPRPQVVGRVTAQGVWHDEDVAFQRVLLLAHGAPVAEASTDQAGNFRVVATLPDGFYDLVLDSDVFAAAVPVHIEGCGPVTVAVSARRR
jgi:hypothetical protein